MFSPKNVLEVLRENSILKLRYIYFRHLGDCCFAVELQKYSMDQQTAWGGGEYFVQTVLLRADLNCSHHSLLVFLISFSRFMKYRKPSAMDCESCSISFIFASGGGAVSPGVQPEDDSATMLIFFSVL